MSPDAAPDRAPSEALAARFTVAKNSPSDINEHLPLLRELASQCEHVTEFGMRGASGSTVALLAAQPRTLISWDINPYSVVSQAVANLLVEAGRTSFQPRCGDTLKIQPIEQTELLFIDTLHTARQLLAELVRHADPVTNNVTKYLCFHDTARDGMGTVGEDGGQGLREAIIVFQRQHAFPLWKLIEDRQNNNGLIVLGNVRAGL